MTQITPRNTVFTEILILTLSCINLVTFPLLLLTFQPIFLYRYLISKLSKFCKPELGKILNARSMVFAVDDLYVKPRAPLVLVSFVEGILNIEDFRTHFQEKILEGKNLNGELKHPELQQYIFPWMGFYFWKWDPNFDLTNHIREYEGPIQYDFLNDRVITDIAAELVFKPFVREQSPWEILLFPNCRLENDERPGVPKSTFIIRIHHGVADGYSIAKLLVTDIGGEERLNTAQPNYLRKSIGRKVIDMITFVFRAPYEFTSVLVKGMDPLSPFHLPQSKLSRRNNAATSPKIPLSYIKEIRDINKASFAGIIMAAFAGALRSLMMERGVRVPEYISLVAPMPVIGHPDKLRNHM